MMRQPGTKQPVSTYDRCLTYRGAPLPQRADELFEQIAPMLGADRDTHQRLADSGRRQFLGRQLAVRRRHRMAYESLDAAQAHGVLRDLQTPQKFERRRLAALNLQRQQRDRKSVV